MVSLARDGQQHVGGDGKPEGIDSFFLGPFGGRFRGNHGDFLFLAFKSDEGQKFVLKYLLYFHVWVLNACRCHLSAAERSSTYALYFGVEYIEQNPGSQSLPILRTSTSIRHMWREASILVLQETHQKYATHGTRYKHSHGSIDRDHQVLFILGRSS